MQMQLQQQQMANVMQAQVQQMQEALLQQHGHGQETQQQQALAQRMQQQLAAWAAQQQLTQLHMQQAQQQPMRQHMGSSLWEGRARVLEAKFTHGADGAGSFTGAPSDAAAEDGAPPPGANTADLVYFRNNKAARSKNLRCFPSCVHKCARNDRATGRFCGGPIIARFTLKDCADGLSLVAGGGGGGSHRGRQYAALLQIHTVRDPGHWSVGTVLPLSWVRSEAAVAGAAVLLPEKTHVLADDDTAAAQFARAAAGGGGGGGPLRPELLFSQQLSSAAGELGAGSSSSLSPSAASGAASQLPDERDTRRMSNRELAVARS